VLPLALLVGTAALADWTRSGPAQVSFKASTNVALKVNGESDKLAVSSDGKVLRFTVAVKDLSTGMDLRDKHMLETFEAEKFPEVTLAVSLDTLKVPADGESGSGEGKGTLGLHGVTKDLPFKYTAACKAGACDVEATADINAADHGMNMPSHLGIKVKPGVAISVKFQVKR